MTALQALLGFTAWTVLLITIVFLYRGVRFLGGTAINHWPRRNKPSDDAGLVTRMEDAHANCLENLPVFAAIVLGAAAMNKLDVIAPVAAWVLYARVGQSLVHLVGVGPLHVLVRATLWSVQLGLFIWMLVKLLG
ncbi:MAPEG family protein [Rhodoferax aquaticus]|uniref:MAPEG family protein n=1 Tax=Rhodoferax aquaticus TaxID=2527691 RepID=A0A515EMR9_9BURK|nr:MAPEG family protein [Rhodoferax aquaticus]QDL53955.1 MAPEG family protein [Rhodoferax aquaticus]